MIPDRKALGIAVERLRVFFHAYREVFSHFRAKPIVEAARRMLFAAGHKKVRNTGVGAKTAHISPVVLIGRDRRACVFLNPYNSAVPLRTREFDTVKLASDR